MPSQQCFPKLQVGQIVWHTSGKICSSGLGVGPRPFRNHVVRVGQDAWLGVASRGFPKMAL